MNYRTGIQALLMSLLLSSSISYAEVVKSVSASTSASSPKSIPQGGSDEMDVVDIHPVVIERYLNGTGERSRWIGVELNLIG